MELIYKTSIVQYIKFLRKGNYQVLKIFVVDSLQSGH